MERKNLEKIVELRHRLHRHPELSMEEVWTKAALMDFLRENTALRLVDRGRWFYAYCAGRNEDAEPVAFRADFDALPMEEKPGLPYGSEISGVCHKCGHDGHSAALAGLALELNRTGSERPVYLIFQHAEEIGGGGAECAGLIEEKGITEVFAFHNMSGYPKSSIIVKKGVTQCTSKGLTVRMAGTPAHASQPEDGKNPSAALSELVLFQEQMDRKKGYEGFTLSTVVHVAAGSKNFGIAASKGEVSMTLRADYERDLYRLESRIRGKAGELAERYGLSLSYEENDFFPETVNHPEAVERVKEAAGRNHLKLIDGEHSFRASEDFGYYLKKCPGAIFYIGNGEDYPQIHTGDFDFCDGILETAVEMFKSLI